MEMIKETCNNLLNLFFLTDRSTQIVGVVYNVGEASIWIIKIFVLLYDIELKVSIQLQNSKLFHRKGTLMHGLKNITCLLEYGIALHSFIFIYSNNFDNSIETFIVPLRLFTLSLCPFHHWLQEFYILWKGFGWVCLFIFNQRPDTVHYWPQ